MTEILFDVCLDGCLQWQTVDLFFQDDFVPSKAGKDVKEKFVKAVLRYEHLYSVLLELK